MRHRGLLRLLESSLQFKNIVSGLQGGQRQQAIFGISDSQKGYWLAAVVHSVNRPLMVITYDAHEAKRVVNDLSVFLGENEVAYFPAREVLPYGVYAHSNDLVSQRMKVLESLVRRQVRCVVTSVDAFSQKLMPVETFGQALFQLETGQIVDRDTLVRQLVSLGYQTAELVQAPGQFSVRGGIVDIYPITNADPVRVEFFDDEIDSLRTFDVRSQRSVENITSVSIAPTREVLLNAKRAAGAASALSRELQETAKKLSKKRPELVRKLEEMVSSYVECLEQGLWIDDLERLLSYVHPEQNSLLDYFPGPPLVAVDEPARVKDNMERLDLERAKNLTDLLEAGAALPAFNQSNYQYQEMMELLQQNQVLYLAALPKHIPGMTPANVVNVTAKTMHPFLGKVQMLTEEIQCWRKARYSVVLMTNSQSRGKRLQESFWDAGLEVPVVEEIDGSLYPGQMLITGDSLAKGFEIPSLKLVIITDQELFGLPKKKRPATTAKEGSRISSFTDLKVGDFVVHEQHGIGRYLGIEQLQVGGVQKDYLQIQYAGQDKLYVPTDQVRLVQKYIGAEGHVPKLSRLGGNEWKRVKSRVKQSVEAMARELLALYATRESIKGHAFSEDNVWQKEFEDAFPYTETPDQLRAIKEVKADMMKPKPMDRLLCGDVGYGKTEVALRAAFKAVQDSKQVAVLVPTTILAQQHYHTFKERFAGYPVNIGVLSRFRSPKEQAATVEELARGKLDIVIGTHRLLSSDVRFKDLGLLIIDEEQRFGVAQKERLKQMRHNVDVLTLTATPIPRTLHMSLAGARDMSVIETPPEGRYPVQTYVVEYSPELVRDAIRKELDRGGQIYFVHNRIADIEKLELEIKRLVPECRVAVAHGRMKEERLEKIMLAFLEGEYDLLLCTTIVENGLDIANVNTLIVDEADNMGLAQLYQLRGRVGRTNRLAYAYFTYKKDKVLSQVAEKRLAAIREFTEFGSGFKIAMRDLELRGAGNLLGPEQHGHMLSVGFDLYCRLLEETVRELKGQFQEEDWEPTVELNVDAYIKDNYIPDNGLKMEVYQRLASATGMDHVSQVEEEIIDRYGELPPEVQNLLTLTRLKVLAKMHHVAKIYQKKDEVIFDFTPESKLKGEKLLYLAKAFSRKLSFSAAGGLSMKVRVSGMKQEEMLGLLESIFHRINTLEAMGTG